MRCNISGTAYRRHLTGRSRQHSRSVADTARCDHGPRSVVGMLRLPYPAPSSGSLSEEHANAAPLIISMNQSVVMLRLKYTAWLHAFPEAWSNAA